MEAAEVVERTVGECGELVLRRRGPVLEIIANGTFLMDTSGGASERALVRVAAERMPAPGRMVIAGLGVGFSLAEALAHPRVGRIDVIEREPVVVRWNRTHLRGVNGDALADARVRVLEADVVAWLAAAPPSSCDAICLDVDNGPDWLVTPGNAWLYAGEGMDQITRVLAAGGILATWSAAPSPGYTRRLREYFPVVEEVPICAGRAGPDIVIVGHA